MTENEIAKHAIYDVDTRGLITSDQKRAERGSVHEGIKTNPDGSTPIFIGPKAPKGWENNWIKSVPGRAWFPYFRFYGPTEPFFDQSWKLPQIEETDFAEVAEYYPNSCGTTIKQTRG